MKRVFLILLLLLPSVVFAKTLKGFHTGPYMTFDLAAVQVSDDYDEIAGKSLGNPVDFGAGVTFGWNVADDIAAEFNARYVTNIEVASSEREHLAEFGLGARYSFIINTLVKSKFKILPQLLGGAIFRLGAYPVNSGNRKARWGGGPYLGAGVMFMMWKYFYFGVDGRAEFLFMDETKQGNQVAYKGGFKPQGVGILHIGVHY